MPSKQNIFHIAVIINESCELRTALMQFCHERIYTDVRKHFLPFFSLVDVLNAQHS